jgi:hypothetical protein
LKNNIEDLKKDSIFYLLILLFGILAPLVNNQFKEKFIEIYEFIKYSLKLYNSSIETFPYKISLFIKQIFNEPNIMYEDKSKIQLIHEKFNFFINNTVKENKLEESDLFLLKNKVYKSLLSNTNNIFLSLLQKLKMTI